MADYTVDIRNLRSELGDVMTKFNKDVSDGMKKMSSLAKSADELGKKMQSVVDPASLLEKSLSKIGVEQTALNNRLATYENIQFKAASQIVGINSLIKERKKLEADAAAAGGVGNLTQRDQNRLIELQNSNLEAQKLSYRNIAVDARKKKNATEEELKSLERQQATLTAIHAIYSTIMSLGEQYDKLLSDTAKAQGTTKDEINKQYALIQQINTELSSNFASNQEILTAVTAIRKEYALTGPQLAAIGKESANISRLTGLSVDEATKFQTTLAEVGGTSVKAQQAMTAIAAKAAEAAGVPMGTVMRDVANASDAVRTIFKGNTTELIKQAAEARKLGTSLDAAAKSAESLLNFETSIGAELKASALLGQSLNFNESRRLAFAGDLIGSEKALQREIMKVGDLDKLNYNQRKALSEATGKDFGELQKIQTQRKNMLEAEREFPEQAEKMRKAQKELEALQKKGLDGRKEELKKLLEQKTAEAELAKLTQAKQEALNNIGKILQPIYTTIVSIQTWFFKAIAAIFAFKASWTQVLGAIALFVTAALTAFGVLKYGLSKVLDFLGNMFGKAAQAAGEGLGKGLSGIATGLKDLGSAVGSLKWSDIVKLALVLGVFTLAMWGLSKVIAEFANVSGKQLGMFALALGIVGIALVAFGAIAEVLMATGAGEALLVLMAALAVEALSFGAAMRLAAPAIDAIGKTIQTLATVIGGVIIKAFDTMLSVFTALPDVIMSVAVGLSMIANIGFFKLSKAAAGVAAVSAAIYDLGKSLTAFPVDQLTSITAQIDMLSDSAQGLQYAVESLKELSGVKLPKLEFGGLATLGILNAAAKKEQTDEIKAGLQVLADKLDSLTNMMANGGISINLDGTKVNHALDTAKSRRGSYGQATIA